MPSGRRKTDNTGHSSRPEPKRSSRKSAFAPLSDEVREEICEMYLNQHKMIEISSHFGVHKSTITRIVQRFIETDSHKQKKKGGGNANKKLTDCQEDVIKEFYETQSQTPTLAEIRNFCQDSLNVQLSLGTIFYTMRRIKARMATVAESAERVDEEDSNSMITVIEESYFTE